MMEEEIINSEDHFDNESLEGAKAAKQYLDELLTYPEKGLLDHEIIITVNQKLLRKKKTTGYCSNPRLTTYRGTVKFYCDPEEIGPNMQIIIDRFNHQSTYNKSVRQALAYFVIDFLQIHPFANANGRCVKFLIWYILKSFENIQFLNMLDYITWCEIVHQKSYDCMLKWLSSIH